MATNADVKQWVASKADATHVENLFDSLEAFREQVRRDTCVVHARLTAWQRRHWPEAAPSKRTTDRHVSCSCNQRRIMFRRSPRTASLLPTTGELLR